MRRSASERCDSCRLAVLRAHATLKSDARIETVERRQRDCVLIWHFRQRAHGCAGTLNRRDGCVASASCEREALLIRQPEAARCSMRRNGHCSSMLPGGLMPKRTDISSILIIGAGPIVIGQAAEFDYSGSQAVKALKAEGYRVIVVNSNPATIMTDPGACRRDLYRADHAGDRRQDHREGAARRGAADDGRADRAQHRAGAVQGRHARPARDRADRRQCARRSRRPRTG